MYSAPWLNNINRSDILPPMHVKKAVKQSEKWKMAVMDSFEHIGIMQFQENLKFWDYYRMVNNKMSYQELKEVIPHLEDMQDLLDGVGVPTFLKHYDILGSLVNQLTGKYVDFQSKFHVQDTGEIAENEYLRYKNNQIQTALMEVIDSEVKLHLAKNGINPDENRQFQSQEEQQAYMAQLEQMREKFTPKDTKESATSKYKTLGVQWGEATLDYDRETLELKEKETVEFKDKLLTGRCFREYKIGYNNYTANTWSPLNTFFSKEISSKYVQDGEYCGRVHFYTPSEIIKIYGHLIPADKQRELLGGNELWQSFIGDGVYSGTIQQSLTSNFGTPTRVPFNNVTDYNFYLGLEEQLGEPLGQMTIFNKDGSEKVVDRYLPRMHNKNAGSYNYYANVLRDDFEHRRDLCQVTEVYFIAYDLWGYLTYQDESGAIITEEVTEEILPQFLKDNNIKQSFKESMHDIIETFEVGTLKWIYRPVCYHGVKVQSGNLSKPMYLYCKEMEHQIKGDNEFDVKLPVAGYIGKATAPKIMPFQSAYNMCMNQIYNLLEKEIGIFFLLDVNLIPSEIDGWGDAQEAMVSMRNMAKDIGLMPVQTSGDAQRANTPFNQFSTHNLSYAPQIQSRIQLAEFFKMKAYEVIGINPGRNLQPEKYVTAEGVKISNEEGYAQVAEIYEEFDAYNRRALELHLSVAQYCQSNKIDITVPFIKSDASIQFLKVSDPSFPLRKIGLLPSKDAKKRKELEQFKQYLLSTNTLQTDTLEIAKLISSDAMSEVIDIARREREKREQDAEMQHKRQQELLAQQAQQKDAENKQMFEKEVFIAEKNNEAKIVVAQLNAHGRGAGSENLEQSSEIIDKTAEMALKEKEIVGKLDFNDKQLSMRESADSEARKIRMMELANKAKELETKLKLSENQKYIATINKN